ncbi:MAG: alpha/beta hydrolase [Nevskia sp.]|nr:alpha/beta hydrolase [Nevskia sp.]
MNTQTDGTSNSRPASPVSDPVRLQKIRDLLAGSPKAPQTPVAELRLLLEKMGDRFKPPEGVEVRAENIGGVACERAVADPEGPVALYFHGGGYNLGSPKSHRHMVGLLAQQIGGSAICPDYRLAPEHRYPAALEDCIAVYVAEAQARGAARLAVSGDSAGGGLAFAVVMAARDAGVALPGCVWAISPWVNMLHEAGSFATLAAQDPVVSLADLDYFAGQYVDAHQRGLPAVSPLRGEARGLPPTLIHAGAHEVLLDDIRAMHGRLRQAGVDAQLGVWDEMFHCWHLYWPMLEEGRRAVAEGAAFIRAHCAA